MKLYGLMEKLERAERLDPVATALQEAVHKVVKPGRLKDTLSGTWLGHPLHPVLMLLPIGFWTSTTALDLAGGRKTNEAADRLAGLGVLSALPTAAAGASDWSDTAGAERRVGLVHAAGNYAAVGLMAASWLARRRGQRGRGVALALGANAVVGVTGYLGTHMSYNEGVGVDTTVFQRGPTSWTPVATLADLPEGAPVGADADGVGVLLVRRGGQVHALAARCTHRGGPLPDGELSDGCVTCPWHGSTFAMATGEVVRGPAVQPQPAYETRVADGRVEVRRPAEAKGQRANAT